MIRIALIFVLLVLSPATFAGPVDAWIDWALNPETFAGESNKNQIAQLETELQVFEVDETDPRLEMVGEALAIELLKEKSLQEALWVLRRSNQHGLADTFEKRLVDFIRKSDLSKATTIGEGITGSERISLEGDIKVIRKFRDPTWGADSPLNEVVAYRMDKAMGLNRVPLTVLGEDPMRGHFSLQLWLPGATRGWDFFETSYFPMFRGQTAPRELDEVFAFDFLLQHSDRHAGNTLITRNGRLALIDNGRTLGRKSEFRSSLQAFRANGATIRPETINKVHRVRGLDLPRIFEGMHIHGAQVDALSARLREFKAAHSDVLGCARAVGG